jgi:hypothetical protein
MRQEGALELARQTYHYLRLGILAVIIGLGVSIIIEVVDSNGCFQRSISAYYYTPVRSVFVGALVAIALALVAMWGRNPAEDAFLNLAGLFAPVVAFVPTSDANYCSVVAAGGERAEQLGNAQKEEITAEPVVDAAQAAIDNNMVMFFVVVAFTIAYLVWRNANRGLQVLREPAGWASAITYVLAVIALGVGVVTFFAFPDAFYANAHFTSAILMFACITVVVFANAYDKLLSPGRGMVPDQQPEDAREFFSKLPGRLWMCRGEWYGNLGYTMVIAGIGIFAIGKATAWDHYVLVVEAVMLALFFVFWAKQTKDRRDFRALEEPPELLADDIAG